MQTRTSVLFSDRIAIRKELLGEIITSYDQLIELFKTGGAAVLTGHAYDPNEKDREIALLERLKEGLIEMRDDVRGS